MTNLKNISLKTTSLKTTSLRTLAGRPGAALDDLGGQLRFYVRSLAWSGRTLRRYNKEVIRLVA